MQEVIMKNHLLLLEAASLILTLSTDDDDDDDTKEDEEEDSEFSRVSDEWTDIKCHHFDRLEKLEEWSGTEANTTVTKVPRIN